MSVYFPSIEAIPEGGGFAAAQLPNGKFGVIRVGDRKIIATFDTSEDAVRQAGIEAGMSREKFVQNTGEKPSPTTKTVAEAERVFDRFIDRQGSDYNRVTVQTPHEGQLFRTRSDVAPGATLALYQGGKLYQFDDPTLKTLSGGVTGPTFGEWAAAASAGLARQLGISEQDLRNLPEYNLGDLYSALPGLSRAQDVLTPELVRQYLPQQQELIRQGPVVNELQTPAPGAGAATNVFSQPATVQVAPVAGTAPGAVQAAGVPGGAVTPIGGDQFEAQLAQYMAQFPNVNRDAAEGAVRGLMAQGKTVAEIAPGYAGQPTVQKKLATLINPNTKERVIVESGSQMAQDFFGKGFVLEKSPGVAIDGTVVIPPDQLPDATVIKPDGTRVVVTSPEEATAAFGEGAVLETAPEATPGVPAGPPGSGTPGTVVPAPSTPSAPPSAAPVVPPAPATPTPTPVPTPTPIPPSGGTAPATPPSGDAAPAPDGQLSTKIIADAMLQGVDPEVKKLIQEMTDQFSESLKAYQEGQQLNEEELNAKFEELKTKNINPYFKQLITNYQTDFLHNIGLLTGSRNIELTTQQRQFEDQTRKARASLEASGMTFGGEALRLLGAESAFGQRVLPPTMPQQTTEALQMEDIPEGLIPEGQRLMSTSSRAAYAERLRQQVRAAEQYLGSEGVPAATDLAGFTGAAGDPTAGSFLTGGQVGDVERQKREAELAAKASLQGVQQATNSVNALAQPL